MAEWFRALDLKSGGPRLKSSILPQSWICFSVALSSTPPLYLANSQLVCLPPVGFFFYFLLYLFNNVFDNVPNNIISIEVLNTSTVK